MRCLHSTKSLHLCLPCWRIRLQAKVALANLENVYTSQDFGDEEEVQSLAKDAKRNITQVLGALKYNIEVGTITLTPLTLDYTR